MGTINFPEMSLFFSNLISTGVKKILSHHIFWIHPLDCCILLPHGVVGSPGERFMFFLQITISEQVDGKRGQCYCGILSDELQLQSSITTVETLFC